MIAALLLLAPSALAQPAPPSPQGSPDDGGGEAYDVAALERGEPAPFSGVLLSEGRFRAAAALKLQVDELVARVAWRDRELADRAERIERLEADLSDARASRYEPGWWERHDGVVLFVVGVAAAGLAVWGATEVLRAASAE